MKEEFLRLLRETNREGMENLISFLEKSDFFTAPASTRFHGSEECGLLKHSLKVYEILEQKVKTSSLPMEVDEATIRIVALLHDICKTNFYTVDYRNAKNELGVWEKVPFYKIEDSGSSQQRPQRREPPSTIDSVGSKLRTLVFFNNRGSCQHGNHHDVKHDDYFLHT